MESSIAAFLKRHLARELLPTVDIKRLGEATQAVMRKKTQLHAPRILLPMAILQQPLARRVLAACPRGAAAALAPGTLAASHAPPPRVALFLCAFCWGHEAPSKIETVTLMRPFHGNL